MSEKPIPKKEPVLYAFLYMRMVDVLRPLGYAVALHGSMMNDLDVVAIPWIKEAVGDAAVLEELKEQLGLVMISGDMGDKPHGRRAWSLVWKDSHLVVDLSIMETRP